MKLIVPDAVWSMPVVLLAFCHGHAARRTQRSRAARQGGRQLTVCANAAPILRGVWPGSAAVMLVPRPCTIHQRVFSCCFCIAQCIAQQPSSGGFEHFMERACVRVHIRMHLNAFVRRQRCACCPCLTAELSIQLHVLEILVLWAGVQVQQAMFEF